MTKYLWKYELYHHGIKGQKWGVRNGPPYPLSRADHSKVIKRGLVGSTDKQTKDVIDIRRKHRAKAREVADSGGAVVSSVGLAVNIAGAVTAAFCPPAGLAMWAGGAITWKMAPKIANAIAKHMGSEEGMRKRVSKERPEYFKKALNYEKNTKEIKSESEFKELRNTISDADAYEDLDSINPGYGVTPRSTNNCAQCSLAYIMRRNGYKVVANNADTGRGEGRMSNDQIARSLGRTKMPTRPEEFSDGVFCFSVASTDFLKTAPSKVSTITDRLEKAAKNNHDAELKPGLYALTLETAHGNGHSVVLEVDKDKKLNIVDAQCGERKSAVDYLKEYNFFVPSYIIYPDTRPSALENPEMARFVRSYK